MTPYQQKQKELFDKIENDFKEGKNPSTLVSPVEDYANDDQICLTSSVFPPKEMQDIIIKEIINPLKEADNKQYYYLPESLHLTIQNIRTVNKPVLYTDEDIEKTKKVFSRVLSKYKKFNFCLRGMFELPTSLSIRAYSDEVLKKIRLELLQELERAGVPDNKKYASYDVFFSNISVCRYIEKPNQDFVNVVRKLKEKDFGEVGVEKIVLKTCNSVCHTNSLCVIEEYLLK